MLPDIFGNKIVKYSEQNRQNCHQEIIIVKTQKCSFKLGFINKKKKKSAECDLNTSLKGE